MRPPVKRRGDLFDIYSLNAGIDFSDDPGRTRQEFGSEADINTIINKFGGDALTRPLNWGQEIDYDMDLTAALAVKAELDQAWRELPREITDRYHTWDDIRKAYETGELPIKKTDAEISTTENQPSTEGDTNPE